MTNRANLAEIAEMLARRPFYGNTMGLKSNLDSIAAHFPPRLHKDLDGAWCAAFVYHCFVVAGYDLPPRCPAPVSCSFAAVYAWLGWAKLRGNRLYASARRADFRPQRGDIVVYDRLFDPGPHDHIGVLLEVGVQTVRVAEGNVNNLSAVVERPRNAHIRGFIRIPDAYTFTQETG